MLPPRQSGEFYVSLQRCDLRTSAVNYIPCRRLLFRRIIRQSLDGKVDFYGLWYLAISKYCVLAVMRFLVVARDGVFSYQCTDSCLFLTSRGFLVPLPTRWNTRIHNYGFRHLNCWSEFKYVSA